MLAYIIRRLASTVLVMGIVAVFVFLLLHLSPGDPAAIIAGDNASGEQIAGIRKQLGLDDPLPVQFFRWVTPCCRATSVSRSSPTSRCSS
jgi:peptide/nickel transport system permease protein